MESEQQGFLIKSEEKSDITPVVFEAYPDLRLTEAPRPRGLVNLHGYVKLPALLGSRRTEPAGLVC